MSLIAGDFEANCLGPWFTGVVNNWVDKLVQPFTRSDRCDRKQNHRATGNNPCQISAEHEATWNNMEIHVNACRGRSVLLTQRLKRHSLISHMRDPTVSHFRLEPFHFLGQRRGLRLFMACTEPVFIRAGAQIKRSLGLDVRPLNHLIHRSPQPNLNLNLNLKTHLAICN